jgi:hypothetical protein
MGNARVVVWLSASADHLRPHDRTHESSVSSNRPLHWARACFCCRISTRHRSATRKPGNGGDRRDEQR